MNDVRCFSPDVRSSDILKCGIDDDQRERYQKNIRNFFKKERFSFEKRGNGNKEQKVFDVFCKKCLETEPKIIRVEKRKRANEQKNKPWQHDSGFRERNLFVEKAKDNPKKDDGTDRNFYRCFGEGDTQNQEIKKDLRAFVQHSANKHFC